jgi:hypothetical protein
MRFAMQHIKSKHLDVSILSKPILEDFYTWLLEPENGRHGRQRSLNTARKQVEYLQVAWKWAEDSERWPGAIPKAKRIEMKKLPPPQVMAPSWDEMDQCIHACNG